PSLDLPIVPTTRRQFDASDRITAFVRIFQGGAAITPVHVKNRILDAADRTLFEETSTIDGDRFARNRSVDYQRDLPLSNLSAGSYLAVIEAADGKHTVRRNVRFTVN